MKFDRKLLVVIEVLCVFMSILTAAIYGNNDMAERIAFPSVFILLGSLLFLLRSLITGAWRYFSMWHVVWLTTLFYFIVRALCSDVQSLADKDLFIFASAALVGVLVMEKESRKVISWLLPWFSIIYILIQLYPVWYQIDDASYVPFRIALEGKEHISGFFGHRNFFALTVGLMALCLLSYSIWSLQSGWITRVIWAIGSLLGFVVMFYAQSRGAWVAVSIGLLIWLYLSLYTRAFLQKDKSTQCLVLGIASTIVVVGAASFLGWVMAVKRGMELRGFFVPNGRDDLLKVAANAEVSNPLLGGGARFYSYEAYRVWDYSGMNNSLGDPKFVHNEYVEALVNYGLIGLLLILCGTLTVGGYFFVQYVGGLKMMKERVFEGRWVAMQLTSITVLIVIAIQATVDFSLHVLPVTLILASAVGLILRGTKKPSITCSIVSVVLLVSVMGLTSYKALPYWKSTGLLHKARFYEKIDPRLSSELYVQAAEKTGQSDYWYAAANIAFDGATNAPTSRDRAIFLYEKVVEAHPYHGAALVTLGRLETGRGRYHKADEYFERAYECAKGWEHRFGAKAWQAVLWCQWREQEFKQRAAQGEQLSLLDYLKQMSSVMSLFHSSREVGFHFGSHPAVSEAYRNLRWRLAWNRYQYARSVGEAYRNNAEETLAVTYFSYADTQYKIVNSILKAKMPERKNRVYANMKKHLVYMQRRGVIIDEKAMKELVKQVFESTK